MPEPLGIVLPLGYAEGEGRSAAIGRGKAQISQAKLSARRLSLVAGLSRFAPASVLEPKRKEFVEEVCHFVEGYIRVGASGETGFVSRRDCACLKWVINI